jgi:hypothetical protein
MSTVPMIVRKIRPPALEVGSSRIRTGLGLHPQLAHERKLLDDHEGFSVIRHQKRRVQAGQRR